MGYNLSSAEGGILDPAVILGEDTECVKYPRIQGAPQNLTPAVVPARTRHHFAWGEEARGSGAERTRPDVREDGWRRQILKAEGSIRGMSNPVSGQVAR